MPKLKSILWAALAVVFASYSQSGLRAEDVPSELSIIVEEGQETWNKCGLYKDSIEGAAKSALRYNRITYVEDTNKPFLYVTVNNILAGSLCVSDIGISVERFDRWPKPDGTFYVGTFQHCAASSVLVGSNHGSRVLEAIQSGVNTCLGRISNDQYGSLPRIIDQLEGEAARERRNAN